MLIDSPTPAPGRRWNLENVNSEIVNLGLVIWGDSELGVRLTLPGVSAAAAQPRQQQYTHHKGADGYCIDMILALVLSLESWR